MSALKVLLWTWTSLVVFLMAKCFQFVAINKQICVILQGLVSFCIKKYLSCIFCLTLYKMFTAADLQQPSLKSSNIPINSSGSIVRLTSQPVQCKLLA